MRSRLFAPAGLLLAATFVLLATRGALGDYELRPAEDNPAPLIDALAHGNWSRASDVIPAMGLVSILLRVPAALIGGSDLELTYRLGAFLCLLPGLVLALLIDRRLADSGRPPLYRLLTGALLVAGPAVVFALDAGHPEEVLGGTLCIAAVLAAQQERALTAAILLGLAIGTKQWAVLAAFPVLLAIDHDRATLITRRRVTSAIVGAAVTVACIGAVLAMNPARYEAVSRSLAEAGRAYPQTLLWPVAPADTRTIALGGTETESLTTWTAPLGIHRGPATAITLLLALAMVPLVRRNGGLHDPLALLVALLTLRCLIDPMNLDYYAAPALAALCVWEARSARRSQLPVFSIAAAAGALVAWRLFGQSTPVIEWGVWLVVTAPVLLLSVNALRHPPTASTNPATPAP